MNRWSRREVIKTVFFGSALSALAGKSWASSLRFEVQAAGKETGLLYVNIADFPELSQSGGSVRVSTSPLNPATHKQTGLFPPVIINRGNSGEFYAMSAACTHEDCVVGRFSPQANIMLCPCHGSQYGIDGTVVHGPALQSLRQFPFTRNGDVLSILVPEMFYEMSVSKVPNGSRLEISFLAFESLIYEVYFRESLDNPTGLVTFATSPTGPLDQTSIQVVDDFATVFVEKPAKFGFFQIATKTMKV